MLRDVVEAEDPNYVDETQVGGEGVCRAPELPMVHFRHRGERSER